ncbi:MAG: hypothetical protein H6Q73_2776 [Firmicutes bacterium]|nr:hypothetical protein [Bacillota bacterium]
MKKYAVLLIIGLLCFGTTSTTFARASIKFHTTNVFCLFNDLVINGYFENSGDTDGTVTGLQLNININGNRHERPNYDQLNIHVGAGRRYSTNFKVTGFGDPKIYSWRVNSSTAFKYKRPNEDRYTNNDDEDDDL